MPRVLIKEIKDSKKNYIINGNFDLWQRTSAFQLFGPQITYHADRFAWAAGTITGVVKSEKLAVTNYSNSTIIPRSCVSMQRYEVSTAQPSLGAGATAGPWYKMEGYDFNEILEQGGLSSGITLSFYVASTVTGTYTIELFNSGTNNRYFKTYTITGAGAWQRVSLHITAAELATGTGSGTWNYTTGTGLAIRFWLASGTTSQGAVQNSWTGSTPNVPAAQVNFLNTLSSNWGITGLSVTIGNVVPDFKIRGESFSEEVNLAQRYYQKSYDLNIPVGSITGAGVVNFASANPNPGGTVMYFYYKTRARASTPSVVIYSNLNGAANFMQNASAGTNLAAGPSTISESGAAGSNGALGLSGNVYQFHWTADAEL